MSKPPRPGQTNFRKDQSAYAVFGDVLGTGLVTSEGERWRRQRALIAPAFKSVMLEVRILQTKSCARADVLMC